VATYFFVNQFYFRAEYTLITAIKADWLSAFVTLKKRLALSWSFIFELGVRFANLITNEKQAGAADHCCPNLVPH
jgi:hypothetical protein